MKGKTSAFQPMNNCMTKTLLNSRTNKDKLHKIAVNNPAPANINKYNIEAFIIRKTAKNNTFHPASTQT